VTDYFRIGAGVVTCFDFEPSDAYRVVTFFAAKFTVSGVMK
jgi:hypothetical protein